MGLLSWVRDYALSKGYYKPRNEREYDDQDDQYDDYDDEFIDDEPENVEDKAGIVDDGRTPFSVIYNRKVGGREPFVPSGASYSAPTAKVYPFAQTGGANGGQQTIYISFPTSIDECCSISDYVCAGNSVIINLEEIKSDTSQAQRVLDFLAGVVFSLDGDIQKVSNKVYVLVPRNVEISKTIRDGIKSASIIPPAKVSGFR